MQGLKNTAATVKEKLENASTKVDEKEADTKFAVEEKVAKMKARGDQSAKAEAEERRREKEEEVGRRAAEQQHQNAAEKERATGRHSGPIGDAATPADLDLAEENPYNPEMTSSASAPLAIPHCVAPVTGSIA